MICLRHWQSAHGADLIAEHSPVFAYMGFNLYHNNNISLSVFFFGHSDKAEPWVRCTGGKKQPDSFFFQAELRKNNITLRTEQYVHSVPWFTHSGACAQEGFKESLGCVLSGPGTNAGSQTKLLMQQFKVQGQHTLACNTDRAAVLGKLLWGKEAVIVNCRSLLYEGESSTRQDDVKGLTVYLPVWKVVKKVSWF